MRPRSAAALRTAEAVLPILGRLFPPDSPEKWKAIESATQSKSRTDRMVQMIKANDRMQVACLAIVLGAVVIIIVAFMVIQSILH